MRVAVLFIVILFASCGSSETQSNANQTSANDTSPAGAGVNSMIAANERSAASNLRAIHKGEMTFQSTAGNGSYGTLAQLGEQGLVPTNLAQGVSGSYRFELSLKGTGYEATATPVEYPRTGRRSFFIDESGIMRGADKNGVAASSSDAPIGQ